jgi:hypothetical protein
MDHRSTSLRDGFEVCRTRVELPLDNARLNSEVQTDLLICYLFVNEGRSIYEIARLGLDYPNIVAALLRRGVVLERRGPGRMDISASTVRPS